MKKLLAWAAVLAFATFAFVTAPLAGWTVKDMNALIDETNVVVNAGCSGTIIDVKRRYVLTAAHCVGSQYETITVENIDNDGVVTKKQIRRLIPGSITQLTFNGVTEVKQTIYRTKLVKVDSSRDLALLEVVTDIPNMRAAHLACSFPMRGDQVYIVGNPMGSLYSSVATGIISSLTRSYEMLRFGDVSSQDKPLMQVTAGIIGGYSGGAVYNTNGELIGVPVIGHRANEVVGFAVPLESIREFLSGNLASIYSYCDPGKR